MIKVPTDIRSLNPATPVVRTRFLASRDLITITAYNGIQLLS